MTAFIKTAAPGMRLSVAKLRIARDLHQAEAALDAALMRQARLLQTMVGARQETGVTPFLGQDALARLLKSQQAMLDASCELARVHGQLGAIAAETCGGNDACPVAAVLASEDTAAAGEAVAARAA